MPELQAGVGDGGVVDDRHEAGGVAHQCLVEQRLVPVAEADEVDVALEVAGLLIEVPHDALDLAIQRLHGGRQEPVEPQPLALGLREGRAPVEHGIVEDGRARLGGGVSEHVQLRLVFRSDGGVRVRGTDAAISVLASAPFGTVCHWGAQADA